MNGDCPVGEADVRADAVEVDVELQPGTRGYYEGVFSQAHTWPVEWREDALPVEWREDALRRASEDSARVMVENEKDGSVLLLVPEGEFLAGGPGSDEGGGAPFPVRLPAYYPSGVGVRVFRGGSFAFCGPESFGCACRGFDDPDNRYYDNGFRVGRTV